PTSRIHPHTHPHLEPRLPDPHASLGTLRRPPVPSTTPPLPSLAASELEPAQQAIAVPHSLKNAWLLPRSLLRFPFEKNQTNKELFQFYSREINTVHLLPPLACSKSGHLSSTSGHLVAW